MSTAAIDVEPGSRHQHRLVCRRFESLLNARPYLREEGVKRGPRGTIGFSPYVCDTRFTRSERWNTAGVRDTTLGELMGAS